MTIEERQIFHLPAKSESEIAAAIQQTFTKSQNAQKSEPSKSPKSDLDLGG